MATEAAMSAAAVSPEAIAVITAAGTRGLARRATSPAAQTPTRLVRPRASTSIPSRSERTPSSSASEDRGIAFGGMNTHAASTTPPSWHTIFTPDAERVTAATSSGAITGTAADSPRKRPPTCAA